MDCTERDRLRLHATRINQELTARRRAARALAAHPPVGGPCAHDYEWFLDRKLRQVAAAIEQHLAGHRCQS